MTNKRNDGGTETAAENKKKPADGRNARGQFVSGNNLSHGRPATPPEVKEMLKAAVPDAVRRLVGVMNDPKAQDRDRIKCAEIIIERVYGKTPQPICGAEELPSISITIGGAAADYAK